MQNYDKEHKQELCAQADFWGMESLTEKEQCIVNDWPIEDD